jgi:hypothetical protein
MLKSIKKIDNKIASTIKHNYVKYSLILLLLLITINVKYISINTLTIINKELVLVGLGLLVVYLVHINIVLALVLTLCTITLIQEYNARRAILHMAANNTNNSNNNKRPGVDVETDVKISSEEDIKNSLTSQNTTNLERQMAFMTYKEQPTTPEFKKHMRTVAPSSYGSMTETELLVPTDLKYENQIGNLDLGGKTTNGLHSEADDKFQNFQMFAKVNMGQSVGSNPVVEPFTNIDKSIEAKQYDHPSSKTITEMLRVQGVDYINEKNLEMIQSNNAKLGPVPCAVESVCGSMNAQSF